MSGTGDLSELSQAKDSREVEETLAAIREGWEVLKDWGVVPARISHDDRGDETWQAYCLIEAQLQPRPADLDVGESASSASGSVGGERGV